MSDIAHIDSGKKQKGVIQRMAERYGVDEQKLFSTLKSTAFRVPDGAPSNEQMMALMVVADQYKLNPFLKEIYAFPSQSGIVPVVGVDGWARIINEHPQFDGMDFEQDAESCTCRMYRKDRKHPIAVTEFMEECRRGTQPWKSHPRRMLRHKAMIQCARIAFGFAGIYDPDEAERISESQAAEARVEQKPARPERQALDDGSFESKLGDWKQAINQLGHTPENIIATVESRYVLTGEQKQRIHDLAVDDAEFTESEGENDAHTES